MTSDDPTELHDEAPASGNPVTATEDELQAAKKQILDMAPVKLVPPEVLHRIIYGVVLAYGLDLTCVGLLLSMWSFIGHDFTVIAFLAGHGLALFVGLSWIVGTLYSANRSVNTKIATTLVLSPFRYVGGILILVGVAAYLDDSSLIGVLAFSFMFSQIFNHLLQGFVTLALKAETKAPGQPELGDEAHPIEKDSA